MAAVSFQDIGHAGAAVSFQAAAGGGDATVPDERGFLWVKNGGGGSINVTVAISGATFEQANPDSVVAVPAGQERLIGPLTTEMSTVFGTSLVVPISYSGVTSVTVAAVRLSVPPPDLP